MKKQQQQLNIAMFGHKRIPSREGGVEIVVEELATRMAAMGHSVICYNRRGHHVSGAEFDGTMPAESYKGVSLRTVWTWNKRGLAAATSSFAAAVRCAFSQADVVHIHAEGPAFMSWIPRLLGKKVVVTVHGLDWQREKWKGGLGSKYIRMGEKMAVRFATQIIVLSRNVQTYFMDTYGRETCWIPNGVSRPERAEASEITERFGLRKDEYLLFLGRLVPEKGIHYLIEAYKKVDTRKKLVIAGGASDTDAYMQELKKLAREDERIVFTGFVQGKSLEELYSNAYVYILPSDIEGMPLSLLEAMSYGNCCLTSDIEECTEVTNGHGASFCRGNVEDLAEKLQMLCQDDALVAKYKAEAADYICQRYSWDAVVAETLALYYGKEN